MAWRWIGDKPLSECWPDSLTHICGTRGRWVKVSDAFQNFLFPSCYTPASMKLKFTGFTLSVCCSGVGGSVRFLVVGTIGKEERPPRGQLWMEQYFISLKNWPIEYKIWADPNYIWGLAILADSLLYSVNTWAYGWIIFHLLKLLSFFWLIYHCSIGPCFIVQHRALFQC